MRQKELSGKEILQRMMQERVASTPFSLPVFVPIRGDGDPRRPQMAGMVCEAYFLVRARTGTWVMTYGVKDNGSFLRDIYAAALMGVFFSGRFERSNEERESLVRDAVQKLSESPDLRNGVLVAMCDGRLTWHVNHWNATLDLVRRVREAIRARTANKLPHLHYIDEEVFPDLGVSYNSIIIPDLAGLLFEELRAT